MPPPIAEWIEQGPRWETSPAGALLRLPLVHEATSLGLLEAIVPEGRAQGVAHDVLVVVAQILAPVIAGTELSQDLASEVALRTREVDVQRGFAAKIIDSLPVGLYVIDRSYRIRAWNRKREAGTQGVSREEAVGQEIFDVLDRQPRGLLKREFDRVFATGEIQQMEMESQASGGKRYYRITKIPMRQDGDDISHVITIGEDVTEWRDAQYRLAETEKLAAVGQLAAGRHARDQQSARHHPGVQRSVRATQREPSSRPPPARGGVPQDHRHRGPAVPPDRGRPARLLTAQDRRPEAGGGERADRADALPAEASRSLQVAHPGAAPCAGAPPAAGRTPSG